MKEHLWVHQLTQPYVWKQQEFLLGKLFLQVIRSSQREGWTLQYQSTRLKIALGCHQCYKGISWHIQCIYCLLFQWAAWMQTKKLFGNVRVPWKQCSWLVSGNATAFSYPVLRTQPETFSSPWQECQWTGQTSVSTILVQSPTERLKQNPQTLKWWKEMGDRERAAWWMGVQEASHLGLIWLQWHKWIAVWNCRWVQFNGAKWKDGVFEAPAKVPWTAEYT